MQGIEFQIVNDSNEAAQGIDRLAASLANLKTSLGNGGGSLKTVAKNITAIKTSLDGLNTGKLAGLATALESLRAKTDGLKISTSIGNQLQSIGTAVNAIPTTAYDRLTALANGLRPLSELGRSNLTSFINQLSRLPEVIAQLEAADIDRFSQQMQSLASAMAPFASQMQSVANGFSAFPSRIQRLVRSTEQYNGTVRRATKHTNAWGNALKTISIAAIFKQSAKWIAGFIKRASDYQETMAMFKASMGEYAEEAYNYAQQVNEVMGINPAEWMQNQGVFQSIITGFGIAGDKAAIMSKNLTQLGYDLASFYNVSFEEAMQKVRSGISGELEPLRNLGYDLSVARLQQEVDNLSEEMKNLSVDISDAYLEQERLNLGISKNVSEMTQAEKAQIRYHAMMTQLTQVQGAMARELDNPNNQLRILKSQLEQAGQAAGNIFIPILNKALPVLIAMASALREIISAVAALFNISIADNVDFSSSIGSAAGATDDIASNMDDAAGSAKKMKSYLMGIDELNVLPSQNDGGSGAGAGGGAGFELEPIDYDFLGDAVTKRIDEIKAKIQPVVDWIKENLDHILRLVAAIGIGFLTWKIGDSVMRLISFLQNPGGLSKLAGVAFAIGGAFLFLSEAADAWVNGIDWTNFALMLAGLAVTALALKLAFGPIQAGIALLAGGIAMVVVALHDWIKTGELSTEACATLAAGILAIGAAISLLTGSWIPLVVGAAVAAVTAIGAAIYNNWEGIKAWGSGALTFFSNLWSGIKEEAVTSFNETKENFAGVAEETIAVFKKMFDGIKSLCKSALNYMIGRVESFVNGVIRGINVFLRGLNKIISGAGSLLGKSWGGVSLISTVSLPRLANGGFVDSGQLFIAREAGAEMVGSIGRRTAVANNDQIVEGITAGVSNANADVVNAIFAVAAQLVAAINEKDNNVYLDGARVAARVTANQSQQSRMYGR